MYIEFIPIAFNCSSLLFQKQSNKSSSFHSLVEKYTKNHYTYMPSRKELSHHPILNGRSTHLPRQPSFLMPPKRPTNASIITQKKSFPVALSTPQPVACMRAFWRHRVLSHRWTIAGHLAAFDCQKSPGRRPQNKR